MNKECDALDILKCWKVIGENNSNNGNVETFNDKIEELYKCFYRHLDKTTNNNGNNNNNNGNNNNGNNNNGNNNTNILLGGRKSRKSRKSRKLRKSRKSRKSRNNSLPIMK